MKSKRRSSNIIDATSPRMKMIHEASVMSQKGRDRARENFVKDWLRKDRIPKNVVGFDSRDMERSAERNKRSQKGSRLQRKK